MTLHELSFFACSTLLVFLPVSAQELPAGTTFEARLSSATGSRISHRGDPTEATIIAPVSVHGQILVPQGSRLFGSVANATAIGFGLKHSTASVAYSFRTLQLPSGVAILVHTRLVEVETAKERVDDLGTVQGIHPMVSLSSTLSFYAVPLLLVAPPVGAPILAIKSLIAPAPNPEICFPAGTELILRLTTAATVPPPKTDYAPTRPLSPGDLAEIEHLLQNSAQRAYVGNRPSDIINVLLIGNRKQLDRAFRASAWSQAERKSPMSLYRMYHAFAKRMGYPNAPMASLTLNGAPSAFVHQKSLDTVQKRHHVRVWQEPANLWLGAAVEDVGVRFERTHWTHSTDPNVDSERAKVVNDLVFTGCVDAAGLLPRDSKDLLQDPDAEHPIVTDGDIAVVRLNDCNHPRVMPGDGSTSGLHQRGRLASTWDAFRDDLVRANILFTTYNSLMSLAKHEARPANTPMLLVSGEPRRLDWLTSYALQSRELTGAFCAARTGGPEDRSEAKNAKDDVSPGKPRQSDAAGE